MCLLNMKTKSFFLNRGRGASLCLLFPWLHIAHRRIPNDIYIEGVNAIIFGLLTEYDDVSLVVIVFVVFCDYFTKEEVIVCNTHIDDN